MQIAPGGEIAADRQLVGIEGAATGRHFDIYMGPVVQGQIAGDGFGADGVPAAGIIADRQGEAMVRVGTI